MIKGSLSAPADAYHRYEPWKCGCVPTHHFVNFAHAGQPTSRRTRHLNLNIFRINLGLPATLRNENHRRMQVALITNHILPFSETEPLGAYDCLALRNCIPEACPDSKRCGAPNSENDVFDVCIASPS
jgi:hypothetical protein